MTNDLFYLFVYMMMRWMGVVFGLCLGSIARAQTTGLVQTTGSVQQQTGYLQDAEYTGAVARMFAQQMTKYLDPVVFRPENLVTREEAAKFFVGYATKIALKTIDTTRYCSFDDLDQADPTLKNDILQACLLHIFKGSQGKFFPHASLTKAEALTVLFRITEKTPIDESGNPRWTKVYELAKERGYTTVATNVFDLPVTRYELALLLWRVGGDRKVKN